MQQTVDGVTESYLLDTASGLTQVLADGENTYLYGLDRIAQQGITATEYFLGDALGSMRQLTDAGGNVTLAKSYDPYGEVLDSGGGGISDYGFTSEWIDATGLMYLRSRYYATGQGKFINRDKWIGDFFSPMSYNRWLYVLDNPVNYIDPNGFYSESIIQNNLQGKTPFETFGTEHFGISRWGLYALLKDSKDFDQITFRYVDFLFTEAQKYYPLTANNDDLWNVHLDCDKLLFSNSQGVGISLLELLETIEKKAEYKAKTSDRWWRPGLCKVFSVN